MEPVNETPREGHEEAELLLPWYVTGQLDAADKAKVDAHLAACAECRAELAAERALRTEVAALPLDVEVGWASLRARLAPEAARAPVARRSLADFFQSMLQPRRVGWMLAGQMAVILILVGVGVERPEPTAPYHTLGATPAATPGNMIVIFRPQTTEAGLRGDLNRAGARLVGGPTDANAYVLSVPEAGRTQALARLRASRDVVMAQSIDGELD